MVAVTHQITQELPHWVGAVPVQRLAPQIPLCITRVMGDAALVSRVQSMGVYPGQRVKILRKSGASIVLKIENTRIALRLSQDIQIFAESDVI